MEQEERAATGNIKRGENKRIDSCGEYKEKGRTKGHSSSRNIKRGTEIHSSSRNIKKRGEQENIAAAGNKKRIGEQEERAATGNIKRRDKQEIRQQQGIYREGENKRT